jgi:hypothetical protein
MPQRFMPTSSSTRPPELDAGLARSARGQVDLFDGIETQGDGRVCRERGEAAELLQVDNLIADQDIADTAAHQRFGLAYLLAALAHRARGDLLSATVAAFVGLGGGRAHAADLANAAMPEMRSNASRSTISAGVSISSIGAPILTGISFICVFRCSCCVRIPCSSLAKRAEPGRSYSSDLSMSTAQIVLPACDANRSSGGGKR